MRQPLYVQASFKCERFNAEAVRQRADRQSAVSDLEKPQQAIDRDRYRLAQACSRLSVEANDVAEDGSRENPEVHPARKFVENPPWKRQLYKIIQLLKRQGIPR
jgi:hypothetical protein